MFDAAVKAVETLDECLGKLYQKVKEKNGVMLIIADHGNCEYMKDVEGNNVTSHSTNKVPCILTDNQYHLSDGKLADIAPTILKLLNISIPDEMSGNSLV